MAKYLDSTGVSTLWSKIKDTFVKKADIDNTFVEVVSVLPGKEGGANASTIGKHLYLIKSSTSETAQDKFDEYVYTGTIPISSTNPYVDNAWELLGSFEASVDLSDYAKRSEAIGSITIQANTANVTVTAKSVSGSSTALTIPQASNSAAGVMSNSDKNKLDGIAANANNYSLPTASTTALGGVKSQTTGTTANRFYSVEVNSDGTMKVNVPWTDTNTTYSNATSTAAGLMSSTDKNKLDTVASNATSDSALSTSEVTAILV